jgi:sulfite dehydrogenase (cytochrome) subunit B
MPQSPHDYLRSTGILRRLGLLVLLAWKVTASDYSGDEWKLPPETARLKAGAGLETVQSNCFLCHSVDYISTQPPLTRGQWQAEVEKMRGKFGAPIQTNAIPTLVDYLTSNYGKAATSR